MTTTRHLIATAAANLAAFGILAGAAVAGEYQASITTAPAVPHVQAVNLPAASMAKAHGCWTPDANPEGTIPGHIVVTRKGSDVPVYGGRRIVTQALEQLQGTDHGLTVWALCR